MDAIHIAGRVVQVSAPLNDGSLLRAALLVLMSLALLVSTYRAIRAKGSSGDIPIVGLLADDRETEIGHALMFIGMIAMITLTSVPRTVWLWTFGFITTHYMWRTAVHWHDLRRTPGAARAKAQAVSAAYHALGAFAMLYSVAGDSHDEMTTSSHMSPMAMHQMPTPPLPWFGWVLAGLFVLDALTTVAAATAPHAFGIPQLTLTQRLGTTPHIVMDVGMTLMLASVL